MRWKYHNRALGRSDWMLPLHMGLANQTVFTYLGILMAQAQIADHLVCDTVCCISCQVKVKLYGLGCACRRG